MSLFENSFLKTKLINVLGQDFTLSELSAYDRSDYLATVAPDEPIPEKSDDESQDVGVRTYKDVMNMAREDTEHKLLLIAHALLPSVSNELEEVLAEIKKEIPSDVIDEFYDPAARLSNIGQGAGAEGND